MYIIYISERNVWYIKINSCAIWIRIKPNANIHKYNIKKKQRSNRRIQMWMFYRRQNRGTEDCKRPTFWIYWLNKGTIASETEQYPQRSVPTMFQPIEKNVGNDVYKFDYFESDKTEQLLQRYNSSNKYTSFGVKMTCACCLRILWN